MPGGTGRRGSTRVVAAMVAAGTLSGCELKQITLVQADDVVVAEVLVEVTPEMAGSNRLTAFLHRTVDPGGVRSDDVRGATIVVRKSDGASIELAETALETCVSSTPVDQGGTCYWASPGAAQGLSPGDRLDVTITLPGGGILTGSSTVPGAFTLLTPPEEGACRVPPETPFEIRWSRSEGAWSYVDETLVFGLRAALASQGITVEDDPLYLLGLSVSAADTTIVFPSEFGVFGRFELDQALAVALQRGLPAGTSANVTITATDRNYSNWVRGGNFNPSGQVRIPSLDGAGTGVFGSTVTRTFTVVVPAADPDYSTPSCTGG